MAKSATQPQKQAATQEQQVQPQRSDFADLLNKPLKASYRQSLLALKQEIHRRRNAILGTLPLREGLTDADKDQFANRVSGMAIREIEKAVALDSGAKILNCTPESVINAIIDASRDGLLIDGRMAYLVPYGNIAKYTPSYIGLLASARRAGVITDGYAMEVFDGEEFSYREEAGQQVLVHNANLSMRTRNGTIIGTYAKVILPDGRVRYEIVSADELEAIRSKAASNSPAWREFYGQMCRKSALRRLLKLYASDPFFSDFLSRSDDADYDPRDFQQLVQKPVATTSRTSAVGDMFVGNSVAEEGVESGTPDVQPDGEGLASGSSGEPERETVKCGECGGMMIEDTAEDGAPLLVCQKCGVMESRKKG